MKKTLIILAGILIALVAAFFALNAYIYNEKQGTGEELEPYRATLTGTHSCLPHKEPIATKECAPGIKTDTGEFYALDLALMSQTPPMIGNGDRFTASGTVTPIERVSADHWQQYAIVGIFSVTDSVEVETDEIPDKPVAQPSGTCYVGGCSSQLCTDTPDAVSTCEYREEYACYQNAICERQSNGACGWTQTQALKACVAGNGNLSI